MSDKNNERDNAILLIGSGKADLQNQALYEGLEKQSWVTITRLNGFINNVQLTFWGRRLFDRLQNLVESRDTKYTELIHSE
jgi:hypothetical protein